MPARAHLLLLLLAISPLGASFDQPRVPAPLADRHCKHKIRLVYFVPADRQPTAAWEAKIRVLMTFVADVYAADLRAQGLEAVGPDFEFDQGRVRVRLVRGKESASHYSGLPRTKDSPTKDSPQWGLVVPEVEAKLGPGSDHLYDLRGDLRRRTRRLRV